MRAAVAAGPAARADGLLRVRQSEALPNACRGQRALCVGGTFLFIDALACFIFILFLWSLTGVGIVLDRSRIPYAINGVPWDRSICQPVTLVKPLSFQVEKAEIILYFETPSHPPTPQTRDVPISLDLSLLCSRPTRKSCFTLNGLLDKPR